MLAPRGFVALPRGAHLGFDLLLGFHLPLRLLLGFHLLLRLLLGFRLVLGIRRTTSLRHGATHGQHNKSKTAKQK